MARILVAEASSEAQELLERQVRRLGHEVAGPECAEVDAILYEPGSDHRPLRGDPRREHSGATLIVTSIYPAGETVGWLRPAAFLLKPFSSVELESAIERALGAARPA